MTVSLLGLPKLWRGCSRRLADAELATLLHDLAGHDFEALLNCFQACDAEVDRPSVVFAYTIKGYGLPFAGDPLNHSALLTSDQIDDFRRRAGLTTDKEWDRFDDASPGGPTVRPNRPRTETMCRHHLARSCPSRIGWDRPGCSDVCRPRKRSGGSSHAWEISTVWPIA